MPLLNIARLPPSSGECQFFVAVAWRRYGDANVFVLEGTRTIGSPSIQAWARGLWARPRYPSTITHGRPLRKLQRTRLNDQSGSKGCKVSE